MFPSSGANCFELVTYASHLTSPKHLLCTGRRVRAHDAEVILAHFSLWVDEKAASTDGRGEKHRDKGEGGTQLLFGTLKSSPVFC